MGLLTGLVRMVLDFLYHEPPCGIEDDRPSIVKNVKKIQNFAQIFARLINFIFFKVSLFIFCNIFILDNCSHYGCCVSFNRKDRKLQSI